jgi:ABC-2 type transport system permease protein
MRKLWRVAKHEYLKMIRRRAFWLGTLGIPLLIVVVLVISIATVEGDGNEKPLGYVDRAGVLAEAVSPPNAGADFTEMRAFSDEAAARQALQEREILAFYVVPADYLTSPELSLYYWDDWPPEGVQDDFDRFMRANLASDLPEEVRQRVLGGVDLVVRSADGRREVDEGGIINLFLPFIAGMFFVFAVMASAGYLLQAVTDEKENRTVEVLFTSLTPEQLMGGKAAGLIAVALSQFLVWSVAVVVGLIVGARFLDFLRTIRVPWGFLAVMVLYFLPAFSLVAGVMTAIGSMVTERQQGQQISGVVNMLFILPFFFTAVAFASPDSPIMVALTLFPTTAFITVALRWGMTVVPLWQLIVSWGLLVITAVLSVWASARIFRMSMLRYGQRVSLRKALETLRAGGR